MIFIGTTFVDSFVSKFHTLSNHPDTSWNKNSLDEEKKKKQASKQQQQQQQV